MLDLLPKYKKLLVRLEKELTQMEEDVARNEASEDWPEDGHHDIGYEEGRIQQLKNVIEDLEQIETDIDSVLTGGIQQKHNTRGGITRLTDEEYAAIERSNAKIAARLRDNKWNK